MNKRQNSYFTLMVIVAVGMFALVAGSLVYLEALTS
jgi:hypothetical protein